MSAAVSPWPEMGSGAEKVDCVVSGVIVDFRFRD